MVDVTNAELPDELHLLKNGQDIHFSYGNTEIPPETNGSKKKKKKKKKTSSHHQLSQVELHHPADDYPTSRVIKQAPNGDVIVESLDEPAYQPLAHQQIHSAHSVHHPQQHDHEHQHKHDHASIWDNLSFEEQENLKQFWEQLDEPLKLELVKIDKESIMELFKNETKKEILNNHNHSNCSCPHCGRRLNLIEDELENIYDNHFDDIINFIHEIRDINDLNALPGLLFGGFHMLDEEHRMQKRREKLLKHHQPQQAQSKSLLQVQNHQNLHHQAQIHLSQQIQAGNSKVEELVVPAATSVDTHPDQEPVETTSSASEVVPVAPTSVDPTDAAASSAPFAALPASPSYESFEATDQMLEKMLDPKLFEAISNFRNSNGEEKLTDLLEKLSSVREIIGKLHKADKVEVDKGMAFLMRMGKLFGELGDNSKVFSNFADSLLKNQSLFLQMMEELSDSRTKREDLLKDITRDELENPEQLYKQRIQDIEHEMHSDHGHHDDHDHLHDEGHQLKDDLLSDHHDEGDYAHQEGHPDHHNHEHNEEYSEDELEESDTESEISEEEKMQEIRRLFLIQVIKLFQMRLKNAYKEKLSEDRTKLLIEELEAEENAKKERELKKLKQKEKAKEKKKLQQLAKDEEKRRKEEEEKNREEELQRKKEELRLQQLKKREDARIKREEEKRKRMEEIKKKEAEQKKKQEIQRKKEEEARKLKEEKKRKAEELRKHAELEKQEKLKTKEKERAAGVSNDVQKEAQLDDVDPISILPGQNSLVDSQLLQPSLEDTGISDLINPVASLQVDLVSNPLLDQLYRSKPRGSGSGQGNFGMVPTLTSPPTQSSLISNVGWENESLNSVPNTPRLQMSGFFNSGISGSAFSTGINNMSTPLETSIPTGYHSNAPIPSLNQWNTVSSSRNGLIWGNGSAAPVNSSSGLSSNLWGMPGVAGATSTSLSSPNLVNTGLSPVVPVSTSTNSAQVTTQISPQLQIMDNDHVQQAIIQAYQILQANQQLEFGLAPTLKLYQITGSVLGTANSLSLNQFLVACRSFNGPVMFDFIYDEVGTVTHIKMGQNVNGSSNSRLVNSEIRPGMGVGTFNQGSLW